jgi:hypothetical protein
MGLDKLIEMCDCITSGDASTDEINTAIELLESILTHIKDFVDETNYTPVGYPVEYFNRSHNDGNAAIEAFSSILEEMESYFYN